MLLETLILLVIAVFIKVLFSKHKKVLGIYSQPGPLYWLKWIIFYTLYRWRTSKIRKEGSEFDVGSDLRYLEDENKSNYVEAMTIGIGKHQKMKRNIMERTQPVAESPFAIDAVYFNGFQDNVSSIAEGVTVAMSFTMRYRNYAEILFFVNIPGVGFLEHPSHPDRIVCDAWSDDYAYHGQGITIEMLDPMRRWKIKYNGLMRLREKEENVTGDDRNSSGKLIHVKFSLIWRSYSPVIEFDTDISASCMAKAFACEKWNREFFKNVQKYHSHQTHYEQWGQMRGLIQVEEQEPREVLLRGMRDHSFSKRDWRHFHRYILFMIHLDDGTSIHASCICMDVTVSRLSFGYIIHPNLHKENLTDIDLELWKHGENGSIPTKLTFKFKAGNCEYKVACQIKRKAKYYCGFEWEGKIYENLADYQVNGIPGRGIAEWYYRHESNRRSVRDCPKSSAKRYDDLPEVFNLDRMTILEFDDLNCTRDSLVGGKGSQLAFLTQWAAESHDFIVPKGFCITTPAYERHVKSNKNIRNLLKKIGNISSYEDEKIKKLSDRILEAFERSDLEKSLKDAIRTMYHSFDEDLNIPVAVRSSAIAEDSSDLSTAGQLETFLGVRGVEQVFEALKKCWASQYSYSVIQYRRQHGQPVISPMGVVIQLLVEEPQISGVMFTQHPVSGNPGHVLIDANYGLGETVVSGNAETDTVVVSCSPNNNPEIISRKIGSKNEKIVIKASGAVETLKVSAEEKSISSLSDKQIFQLVDIGKCIQTNFASPRDIEWAISGDRKINLLQARPITCDPTETEFELYHEFDSAFSNNNYVVTTANIGEMMTGPVTPLTGSLFCRTTDYATQVFSSRACPRDLSNTSDVYLHQSHGHLFFNYKELTRLHSKAVFGSEKKSIDVVFFGSVLNDLTEEDVIKYHNNTNSFPTRIWNALRFAKILSSSTRKLEELVVKTGNLRLKGKDSKQLYQVISDNMISYLVEGWIIYMMHAAFSGIFSTFLMRILSGGNLKWETEHFSDVATILSSCENVVSADAPTLLNKTAEHIFKSCEKDKFIGMCPKDAVEWLLQYKGSAGDSFRLFLKNCGHRCIRELELREKSWADDPAKLGTALQTSVKNYTAVPTKHYLSTDDVLKKLQTPVSAMKKILLKWIIPNSRKSIGSREWGKSMIVRIGNQFKKAYWNLGDMLEKEGYLPESDMIFFLTHGEIGKLLRTRSSHLVTRARRRRKVYVHAQELLFDEISMQIPVTPINLNNSVNVLSSCNEVILQGFPVSHGVVKGRARVTLSLTDADEIKKDEILIARTTDVGWSPYFPIISGLVTEVGGLISHGAIVAREYGLPCIVSAKKATQVLKTGDWILLDGGKGTIHKIDAE